MSTARFLVVCLNPTFQKTIVLSGLKENEVNRSNEYFLSLAGKGVNTARVLMQLGEEAMHLTHLGGSLVKYFLSLIHKETIPFLWVESGSEIRTCYTLLNSLNNTTTEIVEEPKAVLEKTYEKMLSAYEGALPHYDVIIIAGTKAPGYPDSVIPQMVYSAKAQEKMVVLDIKGDDLLNSLEFKPDIIKPNFSEFLRTFYPDAEQGEHDILLEHKNIVIEQMKMVFKKYKTIPVITSGANPTLYIENDRITSLPIQKVIPVNTIGSGDAFTAGMSSVLASGGSITEAVLKGQECGARNALQILPGTLG
ncbi:MAG: tagatose-6-phosphate kinase [Spirochaetales bacterium]|nr:tagatose-6-phosphate kinase [Spirochaetales bacterium]